MLRLTVNFLSNILLKKETYISDCFSMEVVDQWRRDSFALSQGVVSQLLFMHFITGFSTKEWGGSMQLTPV